MTTPAPKVSIGMPVYNGEKHLRSAVDALLSQTYGDFELIISDNASSDGTEDICRAYASADRRVRYYRNAANVGASDNYNAVFRHARAPYFKWASSNDLCGARFLEACVDVLDRREDVVVAYPRARLMYGGPDNCEDYEDGLDLQDDRACDRFAKFMACIRLNNVMNGVIRSRALARTRLVKPFFQSDVSMMAEVALQGKFVEVPEYLFYRRMEKESTTALKKGKDLIAHYDPSLKRRMLFQEWKLQASYVSAAVRARLGASERVCVVGRVLRGLVWARRDLWLDLKEAVQAMLPRPSGGPESGPR